MRLDPPNSSYVDPVGLLTWLRRTISTSFSTCYVLLCSWEFLLGNQCIFLYLRFSSSFFLFDVPSILIKHLNSYLTSNKYDSMPTLAILAFISLIYGFNSRLYCFDSSCRWLRFKKKCILKIQLSILLF